jgi:hypothetical protein
MEVIEVLTLSAAPRTYSYSCIIQTLPDIPVRRGVVLWMPQSGTATDYGRCHDSVLAGRVPPVGSSSPDVAIIWFIRQGAC